MEERQAPLNKFQDEFALSALENAKLKRQLAQLTEDLDELKEDKRSYRASKDRAEAELDVARTELNDAKDEIGQLRIELEKEKAENAYLKRKMEEESQEDSKWFMMVEMLQSKVAELEENSAGRRASSSRETAQEPGRSPTLAQNDEALSAQSQTRPSGASSSSTATGVHGCVLFGVEQRREPLPLIETSVPGLSSQNDMAMNICQSGQTSTAGERPTAVTPSTLRQVNGAPPTPVTPLRIRIPSAAALGKLKRNSGLNGDYWTCTKTPEKVNRLITQSQQGLARISPRSQMSSRPLKRPRSEPRPTSTSTSTARNFDGQTLESKKLPSHVGTTCGLKDTTSPLLPPSMEAKYGTVLQLQNELKSKLDEITRLKEEVSRLREENADLKHDKTSFRTSNDRLNRDLERAHEELVKERKEKEVASEKLQNGEKEKHDLRETIRRLQATAKSQKDIVPGKVLSRPSSNESRRANAPLVLMLQMGLTSGLPSETALGKRKRVEGEDHRPVKKAKLSDPAALSRTPTLPVSAQLVVDFKQTGHENHSQSGTRLSASVPLAPNNAQHVTQSSISGGEQPRRGTQSGSSSTNSLANAEGRNSTAKAANPMHGGSPSGYSPTPEPSAQTAHSPLPQSSLEPPAPQGALARTATQRKYKESQAFALSAPDVAIYLKDAPAFAMKKSPSDFSVSRSLMGKLYGGSSTQPLQVFKNESGETYRVAFYPTYDMNSAMPMNPGESGLLYGREELGEGKWSVFSRCPDRKEAVWMYLGEYECKIVGKITKEQFCAQKDSVQTRWFEHVWDKKNNCYVEAKARILIREDWPSFEEFKGDSTYNKGWPSLLRSLKKGKKDPPAGEDILEAYRSGDEVGAVPLPKNAMAMLTKHVIKHVPITLMKCVGYDMEFVSEMIQKEEEDKRREEEEQKREEEAVKRLKEENNKRIAEKAKVDAEREAAGLPPLPKWPKQTARKSTASAPKSLKKPSVKKRMQEQVQRIESEQARNALARAALAKGGGGHAVRSREGASGGKSQGQGGGSRAHAAETDDGDSDGGLSYASE